VTPLKQQELQSLVRIGFIDCTTIRSHRPQRNQRWFYNSYYKHHGWKQLTVQLPNGLTGHSYGPATIDGRVTAESGLNHEITTFAFAMADGSISSMETGPLAFIPGWGLLKAVTSR